MKDVRVLDLTRVLAGPWAAQQLADQGAQVIKVEPPGGDETRGFGPLVDGHATYFLSANRNKRAITLDLRTAGGQEVLLALLDWADVVLENFRPGVAERLGFGWETVSARRPDLIYVAIHAFGADGDPAWTRRPGYDLVLQCMGGGADITGAADGPPTKHGNSVADLLAGLMAVQAVLVALLHREKTGAGQKIVVNMMQAQAAALTYHATRFAGSGQISHRRGNTHAGLVPYAVYRCDGGWFSVGCGNDAIWQRLRGALGIPDVPEWRRNVDRVAHRDAVDAAVQAALDGLSLAAADELLAGVGVPAGPVLSVDQVMCHPTVERVRVDHPAFGAIDLPGPVFRSATTREVHTPPPLVAEHRDEILAELGFDADAVHRLTADGAFTSLG